MMMKYDRKHNYNTDAIKDYLKAFSFMAKDEMKASSLGQGRGKNVAKAWLFSGIV